MNRPCWHGSGERIWREGSKSTWNGVKRVFLKENTLSKDHHARRMLWWHLVSKTLFISSAALHSPTKWSQKASRKSSVTKETLGSFPMQRMPRAGINLQTSRWSLSPPLLVLLRLLRLLLGERHCINIFLLSFFLDGWKKNTHDKNLPQRSTHLEMSPNIPWTAAWTLTHVLPRNAWTSNGRHVKNAFPGGRLIWAPRGSASLSWWGCFRIISW